MVIYYYVDGKRHQKMKSTGLASYVKGDRKKTARNKKDAQIMLDELIHEYRNKHYLSAEQTTMTELIRMWLKDKKTEVRPNTYATYEMQVNRHILPYFKSHDKLVSEMNIQDISSFYDYQQKKGVKPNTLLKHHSNMVQIFKYAIQKSLIPYNPTQGVKLPKKQRFKGDYYDEEETNLLLTKIKGNILEVPVTLTVYLGLRREEIAGLRWQAIDFKKKSRCL